jgi:hypothetical protein
VVKCTDVSEERTAFLFRTFKLPCFAAPVTGGNIYLQYMTPLCSLANTAIVAGETAQVCPQPVGFKYCKNIPQFQVETSRCVFNFQYKKFFVVPSIKSSAH